MCLIIFGRVGLYYQSATSLSLELDDSIQSDRGISHKYTAAVLFMFIEREVGGETTLEI